MKSSQIDATRTISRESHPRLLRVAPGCGKLCFTTIFDVWHLACTEQPRMSETHSWTFANFHSWTWRCPKDRWCSVLSATQPSEMIKLQIQTDVPRLIASSAMWCDGKLWRNNIESTISLSRSVQWKFVGSIKAPLYDYRAVHEDVREQKRYSRFVIFCGKRPTNRWV